VFLVPNVVEALSSTKYLLGEVSELGSGGVSVEVRILRAVHNLGEESFAKNWA